MHRTCGTPNHRFADFLGNLIRLRRTHVSVGVGVTAKRRTAAKKNGGSGWEPEPPLGKRLKFHNILGLVSFRTLGDVELDLVALVQGLETAGLNSGMVHENIIP